MTSPHWGGLCWPLAEGDVRARVLGQSQQCHPSEEQDLTSPEIGVFEIKVSIFRWYLGVVWAVCVCE